MELRTYRLYATGVIHGGDDNGEYVWIEPSPCGDESFFVFRCKNPMFDGEVFDEWVENEYMLEKYFDDVELKVTWLEESGDKSRTLFNKPVVS